MDGNIERLKRLMPPHEGAGDVMDWGAVEAEYGHAFPRDYMEFTSVYGDGSIDEFLSIYVPRRSDSEPPFVDRLPARTVASASMQEWKRGSFASVHTLDQMLLWGQTSSADALCWVVRHEDPDRWPVAVWARHGGGWDIYDCGMTEFLWKLLVADFPECPLSDDTLWGNASPRFLHCREEMRLRNAGLDPRTGEPDPYAGETFD